MEDLEKLSIEEPKLKIFNLVPYFGAMEFEKSADNFRDPILENGMKREGVTEKEFWQYFSVCRRSLVLIVYNCALAFGAGCGAYEIVKALSK